ncbi:Uncharacterized protein Rs2_21384 [Raphanus sativus]|nr:Uncharacterized protein Rs2_21384 [Raphanus sativus]
MLNTTGTKELDKIVDVGHPPNIICGLRCRGKEMRKTQMSASAASNSTTFVRAGTMTVSESVKAPSATTSKEQTTKHRIYWKRDFQAMMEFIWVRRHIARFCYECFHNIQRAWRIGEYYPEPKTHGNVWVPKPVLYARKMDDESDDKFDVICNISQLKDACSVDLKQKVTDEFR